MCPRMCVNELTACERVGRWRDKDLGALRHTLQASSEAGGLAKDGMFV